MDITTNGGWLGIVKLFVVLLAFLRLGEFGVQEIPKVG